MKNARNKLLIGIDYGNDELEFYSSCGTLLAIGYVRVVIGKRGPYVEFDRHHIRWNVFSIPPSEEYRLANKVVFYDEYRSIDNSFVKLYFQKRLVTYADYKIGLCYISPLDLFRVENQPVILGP